MSRAHGSALGATLGPAARPDIVAECSERRCRSQGPSLHPCCRLHGDHIGPWSPRRTCGIPLALGTAFLDCPEKRQVPFSGLLQRLTGVGAAAWKYAAHPIAVRFYMADYQLVRVRVASMRMRLGSVWLLSVLAATSLSSQSTADGPVASDVRTLAEGWAALSQGNLEQASKAADRAMAGSPGSVSALALAVEVDIRRGGTLAGLAPYERWLGDRRVDDPYALRRIAQAHLERISADQQQPARFEAAAALAADGNLDVRSELARVAANGSVPETQLLASLGDSRAIRDLVAQLRIPGESKVRIIHALVESRSSLAVPPLVELLSDAREDHRAAAAEGLGKLGAADVVSRLRPLLKDPVFPVRVAAASALYRLQDYDGVNLLEEMMASEHGAVRLGAAEAMAVRPMGTWLAVVRDLTRHEDATVQLGAARLIAPYEPEVAAAVLERLGRSDNLAVREEAARAFVDRLAADFGTLRRFLRNPDVRASVRAAARILELTR